MYDFNYVPVLSQAPDGWGGRVGHVQNAVMDDHDDLSEYAIYLCGSPAMVHDAKKVLLMKGANPDYVYSDSFLFNLADRTRIDPAEPERLAGWQETATPS